MIKNLLFISIFVLVSIVVSFGASTSTVYAQDAGEAVCETLGQATGNGCQSETESGMSISNVIEGALNLLTIAAGVAAVIMVIIAGFKYLTSQGDSGSVSSAKNTLLYALIGVLVVLFSQTIIYFFINSATPDTTPPQQINCPAGEVCRQ